MEGGLPLKHRDRDEGYEGIEGMNELRSGTRKLKGHVAWN